MTKRTYKTAEELKITPEERSVLFKAMRWLKKAKPYEYSKVDGNGVFEFQMQRTLLEPYNPVPGQVCKSAGCIWGLCHVIAKATDSTAFEYSPYGRNNPIDSWEYGVSAVLEQLFFPHRHDRHGGYAAIAPLFSYQEIKPHHAAKAVEHFLKTGAVRFER